MKIENLLNTVGTAVQEAHKAIDDNYVNSFFENHFIKDISRNDSEVYKPKMIEIEIPKQNGGGRIVYAPTAILVNHRSLNIDTLKFCLNINVSEESENSISIQTQGNHNTDKTAGTLEITFKYSDKPEGIARIETQLNSLL